MAAGSGACPRAACAINFNWPCAWRLREGAISIVVRARYVGPAVEKIAPPAAPSLLLIINFGPNCAYSNRQRLLVGDGDFLNKTQSELIIFQLLRFLCSDWKQSPRWRSTRATLHAPVESFPEEIS